MKKDQPYKKELCDKAYNAACAADVNCYDECSMPCPYDKVKSPCKMCDMSTCDETCEALNVYKLRRESASNQERKQVTITNIYGEPRKVTLVGGTKGPYLTYEYTVREKRFNPDYDQNKLCKCGHVYYRHFDPYYDDEACGCKYCGCDEFEPADE